MAQNNSITFVFEVCGSCSTHQWNTRHDEAKYAGMFNDVAAAIKAEVPNAICVMNKVPKPWFEKEVYCQLIPNEDDNNPYYDILPRIGAFEVSTVHDNVDILFYSKMMSTMWPHAPSLATRVKAFCDEVGSTNVAGLREKYQTLGRQVRQPRKRRGSVGSSLAMTESTGRMADSMKSLPGVQEQQAQVVDHNEKQQQEQPAAEEEAKQEQQQQPAVVEETKKAEKPAAKAETAPATETKTAPAEQPAQEAAAAPEKNPAEEAKQAPAAETTATPAEAAPAQEASQPAAATAAQ